MKLGNKEQGEPEAERVFCYSNCTSHDRYEALEGEISAALFISNKGMITQEGTG